MGTKDDPMDLGPFLQNYVMKNPFDQLGHSLPPQPAVTESATPPTSPPPEEPASPGKPPTTSGGHMGSNTLYAYQVKSSRVSGASASLQEWLSSQYRHVASYGGIVGLAAIQRQAKQVVPTATAPLITKLMKATFPKCCKFYSEGGVYYQGLVERPQSSDFDDSTLRSCVDSVRKGVLDLGKAMASYAVEEARIVRMLVWEHNTLPGLLHTAPPAALAAPTAPRHVRRLRKRSVTDKQCDSEEWSDRDEQPSSKKRRDKTEPRRKSRRHRRRPSYVTDYECSLGGGEGDQDGEPEVKVKEEAVDVTSTEVSSTCVTSPPKSAELASPELAQQDVMDELAYMEGKLRGNEAANKCLLLELNCARKEADELRMELAHRESQVSHLADEFFTLNNLFQKLQHQFKQYLTSSMVKNSELGIANNNNVNGAL